MSENTILPANPGADCLAHRDEIDLAIRAVLDSGRFILGGEVQAFEQEFAAYIGVAHAVGVGSGTEAIHLALRAGGIKPGDHVVTVSHTAVATVAAIELCGAIPVLIDINPATYTMDPQQLDAALKERADWRVKAVIVVHLYGHPASVHAIREICQRHDALLIEDCAQSHGAMFDGKKAGAWGDISAFSFYPTKNLGALGDGGAVLTNDARIAERARMLREYGWRERYISEIAGLNTRLDELQAAVLRVKLRHLDDANAARVALAKRYDKRLVNTRLILPAISGPVTHVYHQYVVRSPRRDPLRAALTDQKIGTAILYPQPVHAQPAYRNRVAVGPGGLECTESAAGEILSLPIYPQLPLHQVDRVCDAIVRWESAHAEGV